MICKRENCINKIIGRRKYCSDECYLIDRSENNPMKNEEIRGKVSKSLKGHEAWNKGRKHTEEARQKIREARAKQVFSEGSKDKKSKKMKEHWSNPEFKQRRIENNPILQKDKKLTEEHRDKIGQGNKGKIHSEEQNKLMSIIKKEQSKKIFKLKRNKIALFLKENRNKHFCQCGCGQKIRIKKGQFYYGIPLYLAGHNNRLYEYNILNIEYDKNFNIKLRKFIKNRDFNICQTPGCMNTENLHVHHVDYDKKNSKPENLITLCGSCHSKTNSKKNRSYFTEFYTSIVTLYL